MRFTALLHHVYDVDRLRAAYPGLERDVAAGVHGETWWHYGGEVESHLRDLAARLQRGAYRAQPVCRAYIPTVAGRHRPLGVPAAEDEIVQRATLEVLNAVYETDFLGFSHGFRPERSQHDALDALYTGRLTRKVNWMLDLDIRGFSGRPLLDAPPPTPLQNIGVQPFLERQPTRKRLQARLGEVKTELRRMHRPIREQGGWLRSVVAGHVRDDGVPRNGLARWLFRGQAGRLWVRTLRRRGQRHRLTWERMRCYIDRWRPPARPRAPYPLVRPGVITRGGSRMRESRTSGSVEGLMGTHESYSDSPPGAATG